MKVRINITKKDIREGTCMNPSECAAARAINRKLAKGYMTSISTYVRIKSNINLEQVYYKIIIPLSLSRFMAKFDNNKQAKPTHFTIDIPEKYLKVKESSNAN